MRRTAPRWLAAALLLACGSGSGADPQTTEAARYRVRVATEAPEAAGGPGRLRLQVEPREGYHLSLEAAASLRFADAERVRFEPDRLGSQDAATRTEERLEFDARYHAEAGGGRAAARLKFGVCGGEVCTIERPTIGLTLPAG